MTKTNWEGNGEKPDVAVSADLALHTAHHLALKKGTEKHSGDPDLAQLIRREMEAVQKVLDELKSKFESAKKR